MFRRGNTKLGAGVYTFSIPAKKTCPDQSKTCARVCYAARGRYYTDAVQKSLQANHAATKRSDFDRLASAELITKKAKLVRWHPAGDLHSPAYAKAVVRIFRTCPETTFWLYTRGWRSPKLRPILKQMASLRNVRLWFSADAETGLPKNVPARVRVAWLMTARDEIPPKSVDLVFRTKKVKKVPAQTVASKDGSESVVCPTETGLPGADRVTCESCKKCFEPLPGDAKTEKGRTALTVVSV